MSCAAFVLDTLRLYSAYIPSSPRLHFAYFSFTLPIFPPFYVYSLSFFVVPSFTFHLSPFLAYPSLILSSIINQPFVCSSFIPWLFFAFYPSIFCQSFAIPRFFFIYFPVYPSSILHLLLYPSYLLHLSLRTSSVYPSSILLPTFFFLMSFPLPLPIPLSPTYSGSLSNVHISWSVR